MQREQRDPLGDRMKQQYENRTRQLLPRRTYTIVRLDGKSFHTFTRRLAKPYDHRMVQSMDLAAYKLMHEMQNSQFAYVQSDEVSVLLTDFKKIDTAAWFDGNVQKIVSVAASAMAVAFDRWMQLLVPGQLPLFDARAFTIPDYVEVENYFIWRQKDAIRNSIQQLAQYYASPAELKGQPKEEQLRLILARGGDWATEVPRFKYGSVITREGIYNELPVFTRDRNFLTSRIPQHWPEDGQQ